MRQRRLLIAGLHSEWINNACRALRDACYDVCLTHTCDDAVGKLRLSNPDCVVIDCACCKKQLAALCHAIRRGEKLTRIPIVVIAENKAQGVVANKKCGADAVVLKEDTAEVLEAVLDSLLRRIMWERGVLVVGDLRLERVKHRVLRHSRPIAQLSPEQFLLLYLLVQESPKYVSEMEISKRVYETNCGADNSDSIRGRMQRLRKKLGRQLAARIINSARAGWTYIQPKALHVRKTSVVR